MHIRFVRPWGYYSRGAEYKTFAGGIASELIKRGVAVEVTNESDADSGPSSGADKPKRRGRGAKRKRSRKD